MTCQRFGTMRLLLRPPWSVGLAVALLAGSALATATAVHGTPVTDTTPQTSSVSGSLVGLVVAEAVGLCAVAAALAWFANRSRKRQRALEQQLHQANAQAEMAELAAGVLHNVGNVLNSVNVSASMSLDILGHSHATRLRQASELLRKHKGNLAKFLASDSRGKLLPKYLSELADVIDKEQASAVHELRGLTDHVEHIRQIITTQQSYARRTASEDLVQINQIIDDAVRINLLSFDHHGIDFVVDCPYIKPIAVDKHRLLQILTNLISNAKHALAAAQHEQRMLTISVAAEDAQWLCVSVVDNGIGIAAEDLDRIFAHGFTRRAGGHGFGLHSSRRAAEQMGGSLTACSDGPGAGASFFLRLPLAAAAVTTPGQYDAETGT
jgi:signal transduction histidine kinase